MLRISVSFAVGSARDQPLVCESAAFFNESMMRETMTGRNLNQAFNDLTKEVQVKRKDLHDIPTDRGEEKKTMRKVQVRCRVGRW